MFPIIEKLGGWDAVFPLLEKREIQPGYEAQKKWRQRGLPWQVKFALALEARKRNIPYTEKDFELAVQAGAA